MSNAIFKVPQVINETVLNYAPGSAERSALKAKIEEFRSQVMDIPMYINGKEIMESYGNPVAIDSNAEKSVAMPLNINNLTAGEYFISVIPSHPDTGKPVGTGRYHIQFTKAD